MCNDIESVERQASDHDNESIYNKPQGSPSEQLASPGVPAMATPLFAAIFVFFQETMII